MGRSVSPARPGGLGPCSGPGQKAAVSRSPLSAGGLLLRSPLPPPAARPPPRPREPYIHLAPTRPPLRARLTCPAVSPVLLLAFPPSLPSLPPPPATPQTPPSTLSNTLCHFLVFHPPPQAPLPPPNKDINFNPLVQPVPAGRRWVPPSFFAPFVQALTLLSEAFLPFSFPTLFPSLSFSLHLRRESPQPLCLSVCLSCLSLSPSLFPSPYLSPVAPISRSPP